MINIKSVDIIDFIDSEGLIIDVRSPDEYYKGHMPNSINIPLFDNEERALIGKKYKNAGRKKAVIEGLQIVERKMDILINKLRTLVQLSDEILLEKKSKEINLKVYCARGGMRSQSISWLLKILNIKSISLIGGYKTYRKYVLDSFCQKRRFIVIGGKTGAGKTKIINLMRYEGLQTIDLERLACHRGSTFGGLGMKNQPSNEQFENLISDKLRTFNNNEKIYLEDESGNIGKCRIPHELFKLMKSSPRIEIQNSEKNRIEELIKTYSIYSQEKLKESVERISRRLGPQRTKKALQNIDTKNWENVCKALLDYYDKCYEYELNNRKNIYSIDISDKNYESIIYSIKNMRI